MKIPVEVQKSGVITCLKKKCPYHSTCANHRTAGEYREEFGFTPELFEERDRFYCATFDADSVEAGQETLPINWKELKTGLLLINSKNEFYQQERT